MIVGGALHHTGLCVYLFIFNFFLFFSNFVFFRFISYLISIFKFLGVLQGRPGEFFLNLNFCSYLSFSIIID